MSTCWHCPNILIIVQSNSCLNIAQLRLRKNNTFQGSEPVWHARQICLFGKVKFAKKTGSVDRSDIGGPYPCACWPWLGPWPPSSGSFFPNSPTLHGWPSFISNIYGTNFDAKILDNLLFLLKNASYIILSDDDGNILTSFLITSTFF